MSNSPMLSGQSGKQKQKIIRKGSRQRSSHVDPLPSEIIKPLSNQTLIFGGDQKTTIENRRETDSFASSSNIINNNNKIRSDTDDSYLANYYPMDNDDDDDDIDNIDHIGSMHKKSSLLTISDAYESTLNFSTVSRMCIYYLVMFISFALIILFIIRISNKQTEQHRIIDIALCIVSSIYFLSVIIISFTFVHQYLFKMIDKEDVKFSMKHDPHPAIRYMPRGKNSKLRYFINEMFFQFNRFQICVFMCFIHQLISCFLYAIEYKNDIWNIAISITKLFGAFGFILPSICVHVYCKERNYIYDHFWKNSDLNSSINSTPKGKIKVVDPNDVDRETKAIAAAASIFSSKMLMGCLCLGYIVQIVLFMAEPFWDSSFYKDLNGKNTFSSSRIINVIFNVNQLIFRSFVGIFLSETIIVIMFVIMDRHCVNQNLFILFKIIHPLLWLIFLFCVLIELSMVIILKNHISDWFSMLTDDDRYYIEIGLNSFWMLIHVIFVLFLMKYAIIGKLIYEEKLKRKISVFYAYVPSTLSWFVTECMLLLLICVCYLTQISLDNTFYIYDRFDIYRQWVIYGFLGIEMMLIIQLKQIQRCQSFKKHFPSKTNYLLYFKLLLLINLYDFFYIIIFGIDYFYREYNDDKEDFESFAFAFSFGMPAFILLNLQHIVECYVNWIRLDVGDNNGIEMSNTRSNTFNVTEALK